MSDHHHDHACHFHEHSHEVTSKTIRGLWIAVIINILLSAAEIIFGIRADSIALIGDALNNTSDAFSILVV